MSHEEDAAHGTVRMQLARREWLLYEVQYDTRITFKLQIQVESQLSHAIWKIRAEADTLR